MEWANREHLKGSVLVVLIVFRKLNKEGPWDDLQCPNYLHRNTSQIGEGDVRKAFIEQHEQSIKEMVRDMGERKTPMARRRTAPASSHRFEPIIPRVAEREGHGIPTSSISRGLGERSVERTSCLETLKRSSKLRTGELAPPMSTNTLFNNLIGS